MKSHSSLCFSLPPPPPHTHRQRHIYLYIYKHTHTYARARACAHASSTYSRTHLLVQATPTHAYTKKMLLFVCPRNGSTLYSGRVCNGTVPHLMMQNVHNSTRCIFFQQVRKRDYLWPVQSITIITLTALTRRSRSVLTMPLSRHSVGTYLETTLHATCLETFGHSRLSSLSHCGLILAERVEIVYAI